MTQLQKIFLEHMLQIDDLHDKSVGLIQNRPVVLDYGFGLRSINKEEKDAYIKLHSLDFTDSED